MSPTQDSENHPPIKRGVYKPPLPGDLRSPCPVVNSLANHGYISRDGRSIRASEMKSAIHELGISSTISTTLTYGAYLVHHENPPTGWWPVITDPFRSALQKFALRSADDYDAAGYPVLNLNQLGRHGAIEHDVSFSRRDAAQGDNHSPQRDLIADLIACSNDGLVITNVDLAEFRRKRLVQQKQDNPRLEFGSIQNTMACGEGAFIQRVFGDEKKDYAMPVSYIKALFEEERLPVEEGWVKRWWWPLGFTELFMQAQTLIKAVGPVE